MEKILLLLYTMLLALGAGNAGASSVAITPIEDFNFYVALTPGVLQPASLVHDETWDTWEGSDFGDAIFTRVFLDSVEVNYDPLQIQHGSQTEDPLFYVMEFDFKLWDGGRLTRTTGAYVSSAEETFDSDSQRLSDRFQVPEAPTMILLGLSLLGLVGFSKKRFKK